VTVQPSSATLNPRESLALQAAVTGTANTAVTWSILEPGNVGTVTTAGLYTAPGAPGTFHVRAVSVADPTVSAQSAVTVQAPPPPTCTSFTYSSWSACTSGQQTRTVLTSSPAGCTGGIPVLSQSCTLPVTVTITPSPASVNSCQTVTFTAAVANATNTAVTWSVQEAAGGSFTNNVYTAPSTAGTYHVQATSQADATAVAVATVTVTDKILSVAVAPATITVSTSGTAQFTATVTTTCGSFAATGP
jgi:hypothetical protein